MITPIDAPPEAQVAVFTFSVLLLLPAFAAVFFLIAMFIKDFWLNKN